MTVDAGYYDEDKKKKPDYNISAARDDLYLVPSPQQTAAVLDFLTRNAGNLKDKKLEYFWTDDVDGYLPVSDFESGWGQGFEARFVNEPDLWVCGKPEIRHLVVSSDPDHLRKVKFEEVAFIHPVTLPSPAARGMGGGAAINTLLEMDSMLGTL